MGGDGDYDLGWRAGASPTQGPARCDPAGRGIQLLVWGCGADSVTILVTKCSRVTKSEDP
jgi:hypothetical protein